MPVIQPSQIFISYARSDSGFVDRLEADLRARGQTTWVDRMRLEGGDDWAQRIGHEIAQSGSMIVVLSPDAVASKWVRREITLADTRNIPIFPVLLKPVSQVPLQIAERQYIDFTTAYDQGLRALLQALTATTQRQERPTTVDQALHTAPRVPTIVPKINDAIPGALVTVRPTSPPAPAHPPLEPTTSRPEQNSSSAFSALPTSQPLSRRRFIIAGVSVAAAATATAVGLTYNAHLTSIARQKATATQNAVIKQTATVQQTATAESVIAAQHRDYIYMFSANSVAWSPNNQNIASTRYDSVAHVWNAFNGNNVLTYQGNSINLMNSVAWSPNGKYLASALSNNNVQVWSAIDGNDIFTYTGHNSYLVNSVAWSPNSQRIASASSDGTVQMWNAGDGSDLIIYKSNHVDITSVAWLSGGQIIAAVSSDGTVQVWNASGGSNPATYSVRGNIVAWSPNGKYIASAGSNGIVQISNAADVGPVFTYPGHHSNRVNSIAWSSNSQRIASASSDTTVQVWNATDGSNPFIYTGHSTPVGIVAWSFDDKHIASADLLANNIPGQVQVWHP